ncbi:MAG: DUF3592 domain-containing protein [Spirochaetota bacterium]
MQSSIYSCHWCNSQFKDYHERCPNCGGPMPIHSHDSFSASIPAAPREIPNGFFWKKLVTRPLFLVGAIFSFIGTLFCVLYPGIGLTTGMLLFSIIGGGIGFIFAVLGYTFLYISIRNLKKILKAYREGKPTTGKVIQAYFNYHVRINGRHPYVILYQYSVGGRMHTAKVSGFPEALAHLQMGQELDVLYLTENPSISTVYPPLIH